MSRFFANLDPSEKTGFTYRLGMAMAYLVAQEDLRIPWLIHVDRLTKSGTATGATGSASRGDLAGLSTSWDWHAVEAKGSSTGNFNGTIQDAKAQAGRIRINGGAPTTCVACRTDTSGAGFGVQFEDPEPSEEEDLLSFEVSEGRFLAWYYSLFSFLREVPTERRELPTEPGQDIILTSVPRSNFRIGVLQDIYEVLPEIQALEGVREEDGRRLRQALPRRDGPEERRDLEDYWMEVEERRDQEELEQLTDWRPRGWRIWSRSEEPEPDDGWQHSLGLDGVFVEARRSDEY